MPPWVSIRSLVWDLPCPRARFVSSGWFVSAPLISTRKVSTFINTKADILEKCLLLQARQSYGRGFIYRCACALLPPPGSYQMKCHRVWVCSRYTTIRNTHNSATQDMQRHEFEAWWDNGAVHHFSRVMTKSTYQY